MHGVPQDEIAAAITPTAADLLTARAEILATLSSTPTATQHEFNLRLLGRNNTPQAGQGEILTFVAGANPSTPVDRDHPAVARRRIELAVRECLGVLVADGLIMQAAGSYYGPATMSVPVSVEGGSWSQSGGIDILDSSPRFGGDGWNSRWRLVRRATHPVQQIASSELAEGLEGLLGPRGTPVLLEAIRAFHRGLYMAAVDLLAAASEAAWFGIAARIADDRRLLDLVAAGQNAAEVIDRSFSSLQRRKVAHAQILNDLRAQAARLRDLRNYGLHPVGSLEEEHETAFTEAGAALLFMAARPYFLRLRHIHEILENTNEIRSASL